jgi:hypothetical protein
MKSKGSNQEKYVFLFPVAMEMSFLFLGTMREYYNEAMKLLITFVLVTLILKEISIKENKIQV